MKTVQKLTMLGFAVMVFAVVLAPAAEAAEHWGALGSFGIAPGDPDPLSAPAGLAINQSTGDVYVVDKGNNRVERFSSTGAYLGKFDGSGAFEVEGKAETGAAAPTGALSDPDGIAIDSDPSSPSFEDVYVVDGDHKVLDKFSATGAYIGQLTGTCPSAGTCAPAAIIPFVAIYGVAVDPNGQVWVETGEKEPSLEHAKIDSFSDGEPNAFLAGKSSNIEGTFEAHGLAVDAEDNLYIVHRFAFDVAKLNSAGELVGGEIGEKLGGEGSSGLAVDPATNDLYVDLATSVAVVSPTESPIETFGGGILNGAASIAIAPSAGASGYAYIAEPADDDVLILEHSETLQEPPGEPETEAATGITSNAAQLNGKLNEGGVGYSFSYAEGASSSCTEPGSVSTPLDNGAANPTSSSVVSATVTGLKPNAEYVFCVVADKFGTMVGSQQTLKTNPAAPEITKDSATNLTKNLAQFSAIINPNNGSQETTPSFEYSTEGSAVSNTLSNPKTAASSASIPAETYGGQTVTSEEVKLTPVQTTYYYRTVATNETGTTVGSVKQYTKSPVVSHTSASGLTVSVATLNAGIYPNFQQTQYGFTYAPSMLALEEGNGTKATGGEELEANESPALCADGTLPTLSASESFSCDDGSQPTCQDGTSPANLENSLVCLEPVDGEATELEENETYYYRAQAENAASENPISPTEGEPVLGEIARFTTESRPFVNTEYAENIARTSATLSGIVIPLDQVTTYYFQYIPEAGYQAALAKGAVDPYTEGETTTPLSLEASSEAHHVGPVAATGLLPETTYHYRLDAKNEWGVRYGEDKTFTTTGRILPEATTSAAGGVSQTAATISGTVRTNGLKTNYGFEIGTSPGAFGPATGLGSISGASTEAVSEQLTELQPGTTYYYRITAANVDGIVHGTEQSFTTTALPNLLTAPLAPPPLPAIPAFKLPNEEPPHPEPKLTNAQRLSKALKACKKDKTKTKRAKCEKAARAKYKPAPKKHRTKK